MDFYHPLGSKGENASPSASEDSIKGEVTFTGYSGDLYAMKGGNVTVDEENHICIITDDAEDNNLGEQIYIKYKNISPQINTGDTVTQGQQIGEIYTGTKNDEKTPNLSIGVFRDENCSDSIVETVDVAKNTFGGKNIIEDCNLTKAKEYSGGQDYSYCGLIFASKFEKKILGGVIENIDDANNVYYQKAYEYAKQKGGKYFSEFNWKVGKSSCEILKAAAIINGCVRQGSSAQTGCCIAANATYENMVNAFGEVNSATSIDTINCTWGAHQADGGKDYGFCSFHDPPDAYDRKITTNIINPYVIPSGKFTEMDYGKAYGTLDCQCFILVGIMNRLCTTYDISRSGRDSDYQLVASQGLDAFFAQNPTDVEKGTDIMLYLFERAGNDSAGTRGKLADVYAHAFGIIS